MSDSGSARARVTVVGDWNPRNHTHQATEAALRHAGVEQAWLATDAIDPDDAARHFAGADGLLIAPSSPYRSMEGALAALRYARERRVPLVAT